MTKRYLPLKANLGAHESMKLLSISQTDIEIAQDFFEERLPRIEELLQTLSESTDITDQKRNHQALLTAKRHMHELVHPS